MIWDLCESYLYPSHFHSSHFLQFPFPKNRGAVIAITLSQSSSPFFLLMYMWACGLHKLTWGGWSWESLVDWWNFAKLAIPGFFMYSFKWWSIEVEIIVTGMIGKTELAVYTISVNISMFLFLVCSEECALFKNQIILPLFKTSNCCFALCFYNNHFGYFH